uniref:Uncharacterized protein n=1 Tax=Tanacetum cinerariifolium TaxID=118510 RepID=A0A6L2MRZ0_TANCI|nr:hypothetical protein [Tanacetum cinerariifolium]
MVNHLPCRLHQYQHHHHPSLNNVLQIFVKILTSFIIANNSLEWRQAMKEEYDALIKKGTWSLVPRASNTNVIDVKWILHYLHGTVKHGMLMRRSSGSNLQAFTNVLWKGNSNTSLEAFSDADWLEIQMIDGQREDLLYILKSILELLQSAGLSNCNLVSSPMLTSSSLSLDDSTAFSNPVKFRQVVVSLQYVTLSQPDMAFAVNKVCQYMYASTENHWSAVKRILRYLLGTVEHGMLIHRSFGSTLQAFTNVLWKGNSDTSLEAFSDADDWLEIQMIDEAEYKDLADTVVELTWLQALFNELGICSSSTPILWSRGLPAWQSVIIPCCATFTKDLVQILYLDVFPMIS